MIYINTNKRRLTIKQELWRKAKGNKKEYGRLLRLLEVNKGFKPSNIPLVSQKI